MTSALLITAAVGAMVLAHIEREPGSRRTQKELSRARFLTERPQTLPGPGVFARANSVAAPALLPDGSRRPDSFATGTRGPAARPDAPARPAAAQLGSPDAALGTLDPAPARHGGQHPMTLTYYLVLAAILFTIGAVGVLVRRNAIVVFMCVELMLNSVNLTLVTFARATGTVDGQIMAFFVMVVAAAEVVVGLAIIMSIYRTRRSASVDDANLLKY